MLKICLAFSKSEPIYAYKRYAYKKKHVLWQVLGERQILLGFKFRSDWSWFSKYLMLCQDLEVKIIAGFKVFQIVVDFKSKSECDWF